MMYPKGVPFTALLFEAHRWMRAEAAWMQSVPSFQRKARHGQEADVRLRNPSTSASLVARCCKAVS
jgi:hypothetical protein